MRFRIKNPHWKRIFLKWTCKSLWMKLLTCVCCHKFFSWMSNLLSGSRREIQGWHKRRFAFHDYAKDANEINGFYLQKWKGINGNHVVCQIFIQSSSHNSFALIIFPYEFLLPGFGNLLKQERELWKISFPIVLILIFFHTIEHTNYDKMLGCVLRHWIENKWVWLGE